MTTLASEVHLKNTIEILIKKKNNRLPERCEPICAGHL